MGKYTIVGVIVLLVSGIFYLLITGTPDSRPIRSCPKNDAACFQEALSKCMPKIGVFVTKTGNSNSILTELQMEDDIIGLENGLCKVHRISTTRISGPIVETDRGVKEVVEKREFYQYYSSPLNDPISIIRTEEIK